MTGRTLFHYEILEKLGEGGMGVVYKARDTRLDRLVALKVLPADKIADPERKRRFFQEARAASALNHPNIITIHDIQDDGAQCCIVMEYVDGRTLDQMIARRGLPAAEVLGYAIPLADALGRAHAAGIVHRDLKPGNVMVTGEGRIKVLDFGLAKLVERRDDDPLAATQTMKGTAEGTILGTVAYMSPEQAEGRKVDARSDIFSFGAVLYELLTGRKAFEGGSPLSTLAAILHKEPELDRLAGSVPRDLEKLIGRCLRKDPGRRFQIMDDVRISLQELAEAPADTAAPAAPSRKWRLPAGVAVAGLVAGLGLAWWLRPAARGPEASSYRLTPLATEMDVETAPAWSPDGKSLAYMRQVDGIFQIFLRSLGSPAPTQITRSAAGCFGPYWSPDGTRIYYHSGHHLWSVSAAGGAPNRVLEDVISSALSPDGKTLVFGRGVAGNFSLWTTPIAAAKPEPLRRPPFPEVFGGSPWLSFSPDGTKLVVVVSPRAGGGPTNQVWVLPYPSGSPRRVLASVPAGATILRAEWMRDGQNLVFSAELPGISGVHLYCGDLQSDTFRSLTSSTTGEDFPSVSPDGSRIAFASAATDFDLWEVSLHGDPARPLLTTSRSEQFPGWAPSGGQYAYSTDSGGTAELWLRSTQEGWARPLLTRGSEAPTDWNRLDRPVFSPDGQKIAYELYGPHHAIWISPVAGGRPVRLDSQSDDQHGPAWSPDGNWIAYRRVRSDKWQLVKTPFGGGAAVVLVEDVLQAGAETAWSPAGDWIAFYARGGQVHLVSPDGKLTKPLTDYRPTTFGFSKDGSVFYTVRRAGGRKWVVASIDVRSGKEVTTIDLSIPAAADVFGFSLHPDGTRFATSIGIPKSDIWLLEGFQKP
jgi:Tol biopolymer transport system component/tRNA A-37 threonylcarbamoyl transferase component Bud32